MKTSFIFDIEATCWRHASRKTPEIIELGGVLISSDGKEISRFHRYVRPQQHPQLSPFCIEITGVDQSDIDRAATLPSVLDDLANWIQMHHPDFIVSWGTFDLVQIQKEASIHQIQLEWLPPHIDLKREFAAIYGLKDHASVKDALAMLGLSFEGPEHRALTDAQNTARIFQMLLHRWDFLQ